LSLGLIQEDAGLYQRAMAEYRLLLEEAPNAPEAGTARERMNQLKQLTQ
jgi:regulator of sirC expression with transglutaminase-like and TPR domain